MDPEGTYDVQKGDVFTNSMGNICVTCHLLPASPAPACLAVFTNTLREGGDQFELLIPAPTFVECVDPPPGEFSVDLKDVNGSGYAEMGVAYHIQKLVTVIPTVSTAPSIPGVYIVTNLISKFTLNVEVKCEFFSTAVQLYCYMNGIVAKS